MNITSFFDPTIMVSGPPPGSINVRVGETIEGPGGKWVPCATEVCGGVFCSSLFEVGPGRRQVCAANTSFSSADEAFHHAIDLAYSAAA